MVDPSLKPLRDLVLVGGGHTHVQVLRAFAMEPPNGIRVTVVLDTPVAVYSGMVPGYVAGQYEAHDLEIDVVPLARRAGSRVVLARAVGVDPEARRIQIEGRPALRYDFASFDVGSTVAGTELPGVREHAIPTRPIARFVTEVDALVERCRSLPGSGPFRLAIVGGGAGGVELAFTLGRRLSQESAREVRVTLIHGADEILPGYSKALVDQVRKAARHAAVEVRVGRRVVEVGASHVGLEGGESIDSDAVVWVAGAVSQELFRASGLPTDSRGFVSTAGALQVVGAPGLFAVGDCATQVDHPDTPKAGVYAVRQGPVLLDNLRAAFDGRPLTEYRPQRDFLTLLNLGDGSAIGAKFGQAFHGRWVMRLKDWIDRRFMRRFQVLAPSGEAAESFPAMESDAPMLCGGCAAKVGRSALERALSDLPAAPPDPTVELGLETPDDAAAVRLESGQRLVSSIDAFRAITDDPYLVGRIAAVNAASDLQAKGVDPRYALALVSLPESLTGEVEEEELNQILRGLRSGLDPLGITLLGGHTTTSDALIVGLSVEGITPGEAPLLRGDALVPGLSLILTKPLGTGVIFNADMQGRARGLWIEAAIQSMSRANGEAAHIALEHGAPAATDVTGFGLAGHLSEMLRASQVSAKIFLDRLPALPGALELLARGERSTAHEANSEGRRGIAGAGVATDPAFELLFDPQTAGGLLIAIEPDRADAALEALIRRGDSGAALIGTTHEMRSDGAWFEVVREGGGENNAVPRSQASEAPLAKS